MRLVTCGWESNVISEHEWMRSVETTYCYQGVTQDPLPVISGTFSSLYNITAVEMVENAGQLIDLLANNTDLFVRLTLRFTSTKVQQTGKSVFLSFLDSSSNCLYSLGKSTTNPYTALQLYSGGTNYGTSTSSTLTTVNSIFPVNTNITLNIRYSVNNNVSPRKVNVQVYNQTTIPGSLIINYETISVAPFSLPRYIFIGLASTTAVITTNSANQVYIDDLAINNAIDVGDNNNSFPPIAYESWSKPTGNGNWVSTWDSSNPSIEPPEVIADWKSTFDHLAGSQAGQKFYFKHIPTSIPTDGNPTLVQYITYGTDTSSSSNGFGYIEVDPSSGIQTNLGSGFHSTTTGVVRKNITTKPSGKKRTRAEIDSGIMLGLVVG